MSGMRRMSSWWPARVHRLTVRKAAEKINVTTIRQFVTLYDNFRLFVPFDLTRHKSS